MPRLSIYLVECDFGRIGRAYLESAHDNAAAFDAMALARDIADGQIKNVLSVHLVDFAAGTVTDVTDEIMGEAEAMMENAQ